MSAKPTVLRRLSSNRAARFIPSGRTAASVAAALSGIPVRRFLLWTAAASLAWSIYITLLGYFGSRLTQGHPLHGVLLGVVAGAVVTSVVSIVGRRAALRPPRREDRRPFTT